MRQRLAIRSRLSCGQFGMQMLYPHEICETMLDLVEFARVYNFLLDKIICIKTRAHSANHAENSKRILTPFCERDVSGKAEV